jgi:hypothetical protein
MTGGTTPLTTPLLELDDARFAQLIATSALLPVEQRVGFVRRVVAALAAGETSSWVPSRRRNGAVSVPRRWHDR